MDEPHVCNVQYQQLGLVDRLSTNLEVTPYLDLHPFVLSVFSVSVSGLQHAPSLVSVRNTSLISKHLL